MTVANEVGKRGAGGNAAGGHGAAGNGAKKQADERGYAGRRKTRRRGEAFDGSLGL